MHNTDLPRWLTDLLSVAPDLAREIHKKNEVFGEIHQTSPEVWNSFAFRQASSFSDIDC